MVTTTEYPSQSNSVTWPSTVENITGIDVASIPEECIIRQMSQVVPEKKLDGLISKQAEVMVNVALNGVFLPPCFVVSFCTNLLNMVVFYKLGLKERINMVLFSLSLLDLLYVGVVYAQNSTFLYMFAQGRGEEIGPEKLFIFKGPLGGLTCLGTASQAVSAVVALERCVCITHPLLAKNLLSTKRTAIVLWSFLLTLIALGMATTGMRVTIICIFDVQTQSVVHQFYPTRFYMQNKALVEILGGVVLTFVLPALFAICVIVCSVIIVLKMKKMSEWRETVSSASDSLASRDLALTRMIVATSVLFIVCTIPSITARLPAIATLVPGLKVGGRYENTLFVLARVYYLASVINSSFNFFVYYAYGSRFRQTVHQLFSCCVCCCKRALNDNKISGH